MSRCLIVLAAAIVGGCYDAHERVSPPPDAGGDAGCFVFWPCVGAREQDEAVADLEKEERALAELEGSAAPEGGS